MNDYSYNKWDSMSDKALIETIGKFIKHHRLNQNKSQDEVANAAGISRSTLSLLERGERVMLSSVIQVLRVLNLLYIMDTFQVTEEISPILYAKMAKYKRKKATHKKKKKTNQEDIGW